MNGYIIKNSIMDSCTNRCFTCYLRGKYCDGSFSSFIFRVECLWINVRKVGEVGMGCISTINAYKFPKQSEFVNRRCKVCFHYDTTKCIMGTVIRDDREEPFETLIQLDDGRIILGTECQYSFSI